MKKYIGIIVAEIKELEAVLKIMERIKKYSLYNLDIYEGKIDKENYLVVRGGIGKVNVQQEQLKL